MKKGLIIIFIIMIFSIISCKPKEEIITGETSFDFKNTDEIMGLFTTYRIIVTFDEVTAEFMENDNYLYYDSGSSEYLADKINNKVYILDCFNKVMNETTDNLTYDKIRDVLSKLVAAHVEINNNSSYQKADEPELISNASCYKYSYKSNNYTQEYYVSNDSICYKRVLKTSSSTNIYTIESLSHDDTLIADTLLTFANYEIEPALIFYNSWPPTTLGNKVAEFRYGNLEVAWDNGEECYIYKNMITKGQVQEYTKLLNNNGFKTINEKDELGQYIFKGENEDNLVVQIKYDEASLTVSIDIFYE